MPLSANATQADVLTMLGARLDDPTNVYWSAAELQLYLAEALRTWQAFTSWYRDRATLTITAGEEWYDLAASLPSMSYSVTDAFLTQSILYHLLEAQLNNNAWAGTEQFTLAEVQAALQNRLNRFLGDSGLVINRVTADAGLTPPASRAVLPTSVLDVRRLAWTSGQGNVDSTVLWRVNEWELNSFTPGWQTQLAVPQAYSLSVTPPASVQLAPPPATTGGLDLLVVQSGPVLNLAGGATVLGTPDDFTWGVKWGALADLLSRDGEAKDQTRAAYCEQRYQECVQLAKAFPSVLTITVNNAAVWPGSVWDLDVFKSGWDGAAPGTPVDAGLAGRNLLALSPAPAAGTTVMIDAVVNMPVPAQPTDVIEIPPDVLNVILDYAQHLASFKMGGNELMNTMQFHSNLVMEAAKYNGKLRELDLYDIAVRGQSARQQAELPRLAVMSDRGSNG